MEGKTRQPDSLAGQANRFVLLVQSAEARPARLLDTLHKRGVQVRLVHDAAMAMLELGRFKAQVLVIHKAERVTALESLLAAVRLYHPAVKCWRHEPAGPQGRERLLPFACVLRAAASPRLNESPATLASSPQNTARPQGGPTSSSPFLNGHRHGNGHAKNGDARPAQRSSTLAERLATKWESRDDLTAGPLLSSEEIELLRGPVEGNGRHG